MAPAFWPWPWQVIFVAAVVCSAAGSLKVPAAGLDDDEEQAQLSQLAPEHLARRACSICHLFPDPSLLTKDNWRDQILPRMSVELGIFPPDYSSSKEGELLRAKRIYPDAPRIPKELWPKIERYYLETAPEQPLPQSPPPEIGLRLPLFQLLPPRLRQSPPTTTLVQISTQRHCLYLGDDRSKTLTIVDPQGKPLDKVALDNVPVDVSETSQGLYVTCVGSFLPSEFYRAELKLVPIKDGRMAAPKTILRELPRSVQTQFADFNEDGRDDFTLCMFGNRTGRFSWFEGMGDGSFTEHVLIEHAGAMYCHVRDFNGDKKPDLAVLLAQELEMLVIFLNQGHGEFSSNIVFQKPPVFGHSWFEPVDFDKDGRLDLVVVNGDNGEYESPTKNYHGIRILMGEPDLQFRETFFYPLNGAYKALARDFDGDGDLDIAAISYFPDYVQSPRESFVYLENQGGLKFQANTFPQCIAGRWLVMDAGDLDGDGDLDLVLGSHIAGPKPPPRPLLDLWLREANPLVILRNRLRGADAVP